MLVVGQAARAYSRVPETEDFPVGEVLDLLARGYSMDHIRIELHLTAQMVSVARVTNAELDATLTRLEADELLAQAAKMQRLALEEDEIEAVEAMNKAAVNLRRQGFELRKMATAVAKLIKQRHQPPKRIGLGGGEKETK